MEAPPAAEKPQLTPEQLEKKRLRDEKKKAKQAAFEAKKAAKAKNKNAWGAGGGKKKVKDIRLKTAFVNKTPKGEKKVLDTQMADSYDPPAVEAAWYDWWEAQGFFKPEYVTPGKEDTKDTRERFTLVIPPPNVTGSLHIGHALTNSVEDTLCRWHRMSGREVLWVPGTDHAGIATQSVVEKKLAKEGVTRHDLGREAFLKKVYEWKEEYGGKITNQLRRLGSSLDWSRERFTMDDTMSTAVLEAFVRFFDSGLIYRANRLVNWSCALNTAISNLECDEINFDVPKKMAVPGHNPNMTYPFGQIWSFAYKVVPGQEGVKDDEEIVCATTRPETMVGDTAVAVHPEDPRYKHLHGKLLQHPFVDRQIPIITDSVLVDMDFGTGAVKVTPAHDPNDFETGVRHNLESINILNENGTMNENSGPLTGMMRFDARYEIIKLWKEKDLYRGIAPNKMCIQKCSRSGDIIEPLLKPQWYVKTDDIAKRACDKVNSKELKIIPESRIPHWNMFMENPLPWCISRQLWWGHRIPAYRVISESLKIEGEEWVVGRTEAEAKERAEKKYGSSDFTLEQDEDVLDTWFSSGLFPFAVMGWPEKTPDLERFYPTQLLETGRDILFFWVARMVMMGLELTDKLPFDTVLLHAMVRDAHGRKMSKSLGNVLDPIDVIEGITLQDLHKKLEQGNLPPDEIKEAIRGQKEDFPNGISECGTDALRFALLSYTAQDKDINLDINRVVALRNFCNKIWNSYKLSTAFLGDDFVPSPAVDIPENASDIDLWILSRMESATVNAHKGFETMEFGVGTSALHGFWLYDFCDIYLETIKPVMKSDDEPAKKAIQETLYLLIDEFLRLLSPCMPYITEELYQRLPRREGDATETITHAEYPVSRPARANPELEANMQIVMKTVTAVRSMFASYNLIPKKIDSKISLGLTAAGSPIFTGALKDALMSLTQVKQLDILSDSDTPPSGVGSEVVNENVTLYVHLKGLVDPEKELAKLEKKLVQLNKQVTGVKTRQARDTYAKVPQKVVDADNDKLTKCELEIASVESALAIFKSMTEE